MKPSKYILLIHSQEEILLEQEALLKSFYDGEVLTNQEAIVTYKNPEVIILDVGSLPLFYKILEEENIQSPVLVLANGDQASIKDYPLVTAFFDQPHGFADLTKNLLKSLPKKLYIPVKVSVLLRLEMGRFDLYLKLSDKNFVKIVHKGEPFLETDAQKLKAKNIFELYIREEDSAAFLKLLDEEQSSSLDPVEEITKSIESLETFEEVAKAMGWPPSVLADAQKSVTQAVKILSKNTNILGTLKKRLSDPSSPYSRHVGLLSYLVCAFSSSLGWIGEAGQVKLAMAALIHDVAVDESYYENIHAWNKRAADPTDRSQETIRYRMHPYEASKVIRSLDSFSPDVDQIILQHHEVRDGSGFPRGMDAKRIGHLPALFIIVEDLVEFIDDGENIETSVIDFITWGEAHYDTAHFKKIFQGFKEKLKI